MRFYRFVVALVLLTLFNACSRKFHLQTISKPSQSTYHAAQVEPSVAINAMNPQELIAGTVLNDFYFSKNGGKSWTSSSLNSAYGVNGDPVVLIDPYGRYYYYFHLSNPYNGTRLDRIVCQRTSSLYKPLETVGHTEVNGKMHDKHSAAIDPNSGVIHMAWTQFDKYKSAEPGDSSIIVYSNSSDFGKTWKKPKRISKLAGNCLDNSGTIEGVSICIGLNAEVFVAYCLNEKIYFNASFDGGEHWLEQGEMTVAEQPGGWNFEIPGIYRMNGFPSLQIDRSESTYRGRLYLSWSDQRNGSNDTDVWLIFSDDSGKNWSKPIRVNDDKMGNQQFMSTMRVDPKTGTIVALFYDRRNFSDWHTDVFLAFSKDGGNTFQNIKVNKKPFLPDPSKFFGDYLALEIYGDVIHAMWPEMHQRQIKLKHLRVKNLPK
jgi:hypothetical protein